MQQDKSTNNKRIAKNTLVLYVRMLFLMAIGFYTSRVILEALGVEDFGIYNVVGGFVALFAILSKSLSGAASRFLNFEMGRGNEEKLSKVFSTTVSIQIFLALIIAIIAEIFGMWFVNSKMVIPPDRLYATNWVFHFSVLTFCANLLMVPYHAAIIAHERMNVFAYISIFEGIAKLLICYLLFISPADKLILYSILMFLIQVVVCFANYIYCIKKFKECKYHFVKDKSLILQIFSYSTWNTIGTSSAILRNQGGNVLINLFAGPTVNAARAIANQVLHAVNGFVENFFVALRPQITKAYASGDRDYMMMLIFQGSRLSFYMLLFLSLPILINADYLLHLWLKTVPDHSVLFVQLTLAFTMIESISSPLITAQLATGKIRDYQLVVGSLQMMNFPVSYVCLKLGAIPETILIVAIVIGVLCLFFRLWMLRKMISINIGDFANKVLLNCISVTIVSIILPFFIRQNMPESFLALIIISLISLMCSTISILFVGCQKSERQLLWSKIRVLWKKYRF